VIAPGRAACLLLLVLSWGCSSTAHRPAGPLDFPWGASRKDLVAQYGDRIRPSPRQAPEDTNDQFEITDYEFEGLLFVATFKVNRKTDALGEVVLILSSSEEAQASLLSGFNRLDSAFTKLLGAADARYISNTNKPAIVTRGVIWSKASPWVLLRYEYVQGLINALIIHVQESSRRTLLG